MAELVAGLPLPAALVAAAEAEGRTAWLATLPGTVARLARAWSLTVEAPFAPGGRTAWVAPVRDRAGDERVLKVGWRHPEAEHEADGCAPGPGAARSGCTPPSAPPTRARCCSSGAGPAPRWPRCRNRSRTR
ncbi:hypothetical protein [Candidatus Blastococcus massiliensis]|uniref:hypothetical protein n=1 Tax=Candidatus Blastococcus massiliensis TaxID=1470358 RepID=UPI0004BC1C66|nr:hypothetical protein [Candidatus Blastococcus massiliensis]